MRVLACVLRIPPCVSSRFPRVGAPGWQKEPIVLAFVTRITRTTARPDETDRDEPRAAAGSAACASRRYVRLLCYVARCVRLLCYVDGSHGIRRSLCAAVCRMAPTVYCARAACLSARDAATPAAGPPPFEPPEPPRAPGRTDPADRAVCPAIEWANCSKAWGNMVSVQMWPVLANLLPR